MRLIVYSKDGEFINKLMNIHVIEGFVERGWSVSVVDVDWK